MATVLVVDDDATKRLALKAALSPLGLSVIEADSGQAALRLILEQDFAVILLDIRMPDMDGFETAALIRSRLKSEMTPIIFMTAFAADEMSPKSRYVSGAVDFMLDPIQPDELRAKVSVFVSLQRQAAMLARQTREVQISADHLKLLTDVAPIGIFRTDSDQKFVYTNPRWTEISGVSWKEALGRDWATIIGSDESSGVAFDDSSITTSVASVGERFEMSRPDGTTRVVLVTSEPVHDDKGEVTDWVGTLADVTAETRAEEERSRFQSLVQNSRDVIAVIDAGGRCSYVSPGVRDVSGYSPEEVIGSMGFDFIHPEDVEVITSHLAEIATTPDLTTSVELRTQTKDGRWIWIEIRAVNRLNDPTIQGIVINYHEISERREAAHQLAQSEKLLAEGQAISHLGSFTWDILTDELFWSDELYRLLGLEPGSVPASFETLLERIHPGDRVAFSNATRESAEEGTPFKLHFRVAKPDGTTRWMNGMGEITLEHGVPIRMTGMSHDISDRRIAEDDRQVLLADQEKLATQLRDLLDSTGEGIYGLDPAGVCTFMNKAGASILGESPDFFVGKHMHELMHHTRPDGSVYPKQECDIVGLLRTGPMELESELLWRMDGTSFPADLSSNPIEEGGAVVAFQDVTSREVAAKDKEKLESDLVQAQKMEAVGQLAGGIAHDFNNLLSVILNYALFAREGLEPGDARLADIREISKAGEKAVKLIRQLLAFSRKEMVESRVIDVNEVITDVYQILARSLGEDVDLIFEASEDAATVNADPGRIEQVLLNLAVNARDAMPDGGTLRVSTAIISLTNGQYPTLAHGNYVRIVVTDTGMGMDDYVAAHLFEPFFTTKSVGEGSGMGLSSSHGIIEQASGCLSVESELGKGTRFLIHLPLSEGDVEEEVTETSVGVVTGTETILLVEDEDAVRELISRILTRQGYSVVPHSSGPEALEYCKSNGGSVDLLLTDVVMPKMSGKELAEEASAICDGLKTLFMSGYNDELIGQRGILASGKNLITKPFDSEKLLETVRALLDATSVS